ncbi:MAG: FprA family A-type flavoprotein, partial [Christensenellaceae bacterium]
MNQITDNVFYVGVNDHAVDLFEGQYIVPNGMAYNSYVVMDEKIAVMDTVDANFTEAWLSEVERALDGKAPDYLIVHHMEPDHSASIMRFVEKYPDVTVVGNAKTFAMAEQFFHQKIENRLIVTDKARLSLGQCELTFVFAPMVHWPEVMMSYESKNKVLFSADAFGKFGALDVEEEWACEARRYYFGIVGKFGPQVQAVLKKAAALDIDYICPLHGPILRENLGYYIDLYQKW